MKLRFEVDCTPEEARKAVEAGMPENIVKSWLSLAPTNPEQLFGLFGKFFGGKAKE